MKSPYPSLDLGPHYSFLVLVLHCLSYLIIFLKLYILVLLFRINCAHHNLLGLVDSMLLLILLQLFIGWNPFCKKLLYLLWGLDLHCSFLVQVHHYLFNQHIFLGLYIFILLSQINYALHIHLDLENFKLPLKLLQLSVKNIQIYMQ